MCGAELVMRLKWWLGSEDGALWSEFSEGGELATR
jgi:hypothetical protein